MESKELVGNLATCVTIFMFLCPLPLMLKIYKQKSLGDNFNPLPYAFTSVLASLWWYYGEIVQDSHMITVNAVGSILETSYCFLILKYRGVANSACDPRSLSFTCSLFS